MLAERSRKVVPSLENAERFQAIQRRALEDLPIKVRMHETDIVCETVDGFPIEQIRERAAFLNGTWGRGKTWLTDSIEFLRPVLQ